MTSSCTEPLWCAACPSLGYGRAFVVPRMLHVACRYCPEQSFPYDGNFCPTGQPAWSAFRQPAFGHATLDFLNSTHALYRFNRNIDSVSEVADSFYLVRDLSCPNKAYEPALAPSPADGKPMPGTGSLSTAGK